MAKDTFTFAELEEFLERTKDAVDALETLDLEPGEDLPELLELCSDPVFRAICKLCGGGRDAAEVVQSTNDGERDV